MPTTGADVRLSAASVAQGLEDIKNLSVREAFDQLRSVWPAVTVVLSIVIVLALVAGGVLRPGGFRKAGVRDVKPFPALMWLFAGMLVILAQQLVATWVLSMPRLVGPLPAGEPLTLRAIAAMQALSGLVAGVVGIGLFAIMAKTAPEGGLKVGGLDPLVGLGCFLLAMPLVQLSSMGAEWIYTEVYEKPPMQVAHSTLQMIIDNRDSPMAWLLIAAVVIGAPLVEELAFRGGLQSAILKVTGSAWAAVLGTSALFAAVHYTAVPEGGRYALVQLFVLSVAMGLAFERTKRLGVPIVMHMCFNGLMVALALSLPEATSAAA